MTFFFLAQQLLAEFPVFCQGTEQDKDDRWAVELSTVEQWGSRKLGQPVDEGVGKSQQQLME